MVRAGLVVALMLAGSQANAGTVRDVVKGLHEAGALNYFLIGLIAGHEATLPLNKKTLKRKGQLVCVPAGIDPREMGETLMSHMKAGPALLDFPSETGLSSAVILAALSEVYPCKKGR